LLDQQKRDLQSSREAASRLAGVSSALQAEIITTRDEVHGSMAALSARAAADALAQQQNTSDIMLRLEERLAHEIAGRAAATSELQRISSQLGNELRTLKGRLATTAPALQKKLDAA